MEAIERDIDDLLNGAAVEADVIDIIPDMMDQFVPQTKRNVGYIVCGVLFNEAGEVLMMQEAKRSCHGEWYLPAGRMEPGETIKEGVIREVLEETGLLFEPTTLICVELQQGTWFRFTFTGKVTGGNLKTPAQKDSESLQAKWLPVGTIKSKSREYPIRATDIFPLIDLAVSHRDKVTVHPDVLPAEVPHNKLLNRPILVFNQSNSLKILVGTKGKLHIPVTLHNLYSRLTSNASAVLLKEAFNDIHVLPRGLGVVGLQYCGKPAYEHDGICMNVISIVTAPENKLPVVSDGAQFMWCDIKSTALIDKIKERIQPRRTVPLIFL